MTIHTFQLTGEYITDSGLAVLRQFVADHVDANLEMWKSVNPNRDYIGVYVPNAIGNQWVVQTGEYRGTFPKRFAAFFRKASGLRCPDKFIAQLGEIARRHVAPNTAFHFDFTDDLNWQAGDFGDDGSCYWGERGGARDALMSVGGYAVRFYADADGNGGFARAWIMPYQNGIVVFNGYGYTTLRIAQILAAWFGGEYLEVSLCNKGYTSGLIYINGGVGFFIVPSDANGVEVSRIDLNIHTSEFENNCAECGEYVYVDNVYYGPNDRAYCEQCYDELFTVCDDCHEHAGRYETRFVADIEHDVCPNCAAEYVECSQCNDLIAEPIQFEGLAYCESCAPSESAAQEGA